MMNIFETLSANPSFEGAIKAASVIEPVTPESFRQMFDVVCESLADDYREGTRAFIETNHPNLLAELQETDDRMIQAWRSLDLPAFKEALGQWKQIHEAMIHAFEEHRCQVQEILNSDPHAYRILTACKAGCYDAFDALDRLNVPLLNADTDEES